MIANWGLIQSSQISIISVLKLPMDIFSRQVFWTLKQFAEKIITGSVFLTENSLFLKDSLSFSDSHSLSIIFPIFLYLSNSALKPLWGSSTYHTHSLYMLYTHCDRIFKSFTVYYTVRKSKKLQGSNIKQMENFARFLLQSYLMGVF